MGGGKDSPQKAWPTQSFVHRAFLTAKGQLASSVAGDSEPCLEASSGLAVMASVREKPGRWIQGGACLSQGLRDHKNSVVRGRH